MTYLSLRRPIAATATLVILAALLASASAVRAQEAGPVGDWSGVLDTPQGKLTVIFHITEAEDGTLSATLDSPDQNATGIPSSGTTFEDGELSIDVATVAGGFVGTMSDDGTTIEGTWSQGGSALALVLERVEGDGGR